MIDVSAPAHAVLSQIFPEHLHDLSLAHRASLNQADHHPHVLDHEPGPGAEVDLGSGAGWSGSVRSMGGRFGSSALIEGGLLFLTVGVAVVGDTTTGRLLLAVGLPAAEGTTQVVAAGIARMGEKENSAVPAPLQAGSQLRLGTSNRSQEQIILRHQAGYRTSPIPVGPKLKMLRNPDCKKPKLSLRMLTLNSMSSSYRIAVKASRRWDEDFLSPARQPHVPRARSAGLLGKEKTSIQVGQFS